MENNNLLNKSKISQITSTGVMTAIICILGPLSIPIGIVPISFANLAIYIALYILGMKKGTASLFLYLMIGFVGVPVFSNFKSGPATLLGPTGGYLIGYIFMAIIAGFFIDKYYNKPLLCIIGMIIGTAICYVFGSSWLAYQANITVKAGFAAGVIPFIPGDLTKIIISAFIGPKIKNRINF